MADDKSGRHVLIDYTNHAGIRSIRQIAPVPDGFRFGATEWHPEPQWLLDAYDVRKDDMRTFAVVDIHHWWPTLADQQASIDVSIAKQLQLSMELNARIKNRLSDLASRAAKTDPSNFTPHDLLLRITAELPAAIAAILKDEDPA